MRSPCLVVAFLAVTFLEAAIGQSPSISAAAAAQKKRDADKKSKYIYHIINFPNFFLKKCTYLFFSQEDLPEL